MTEIKVLCNCGQKFKFDVEPVNGLMPYAVNCPVCGTDGTASANALLSQNAPVPVSAPVVPVARVAMAVRAPAVAPMVPVSVAPPPVPVHAGQPAAARPLGKKAVSPQEFNLAMGVVGAFAGALVGAALVVAFYFWANFRFPYSGSAIGALGGLGARLLYRGTGSTIGLVSCVVGAIAAAAANFVMYGSEISDKLAVVLVSTLVSAFMGWRIASG